MSATKVSHLPSTAYAISEVATVDSLDSQGCLPHQVFMQSQVIDTQAAATLRAASGSPASFPAPAAALASTWSCLPIQTLSNFEPVDRQFAPQQVCFESTIALRPSNPHFQAEATALTLMAHAPRSGLKITLGQAIIEIDFGYISTAPLTISCLDADGHCVAIAQGPSAPSINIANDTAAGVYDVQGLMLNTLAVRTLRIDSAAPFVLTRFWVKPATG
ncbi:MAG: hypothetical protein ACFBSG_09530 [Leptolyngbyaceae cyanobacterium]